MAHDAVWGGHHTVWGGIENSSQGSASTDGSSFRKAETAAVVNGVVIRDSSSSSSSFCMRNREDRRQSSGFDYRLEKQLENVCDPGVGNGPSTAFGVVQGQADFAAPCAAPAQQPCSMQAFSSAEDGEVLKQILLEAGLWSDGSSKHEHGTCIPCREVCRGRGCVDGKDCPNCHIPHTKEATQKIGMHKRRHCQAFARALRSGLADAPERLRRIAAIVGSHSPYLLRLTLSDEGGAASEDPEPVEADSTAKKKIIVSL